MPRSSGPPSSVARPAVDVPATPAVDAVDEDTRVRPDGRGFPRCCTDRRRPGVRAAGSPRNRHRGVGSRGRARAHQSGHRARRGSGRCAGEPLDGRRRRALADADTHAAAIAPALGLLDEAPGFAAACRLAGSGALDRAQFERISQQHRAGRGDIHVLTGLGRASRWPELTAERVAGVLTAARDWAEVTVVDVAASFEHDEELMTDLNAPRRNAATIEVLRTADLVVAVGAADPIGLSRFLRAHAELAELVEPDRVLTVINKLRSSAIGLNPAAQVRQTLGAVRRDRGAGARAVGSAPRSTRRC